MTPGQYDQLVETRTDQILGDEFTAAVYAVYFETQLHRGKVRHRIGTCLMRFARGAAMAFSFYPEGGW